MTAQRANVHVYMSKSNQLYAGHVAKVCQPQQRVVAEASISCVGVLEQ